jgi:lipopolysaccharide/colanic/teichoic acid biosynthesis glycosyltransferase
MSGQGFTRAPAIAFPHLSVMRAQRLLELFAYRIAPALVAGAIASAQSARPADGLLVFAALVAASVLLERERFPFHLMPLAGVAVRAAMPLLGAGLALATFALAGSPQPLSTMAMPLLGALIVMPLGAWLTWRFQSHRRVRIAVIGSEEIACGLDEELRAAGIRTYEVKGWLCHDPVSTEQLDGVPRRLGSLDQIRDIVRRGEIDLLVHSAAPPPKGDDHGPQPSRLEIFEQVAAQCLDLPVRLMEASQLYEDLLGHVPLGQSNSAWFQYLMHPRYRATSPISKRAFDLVVGTAMSIVLLPLLSAFALMIKLTDGGPIFYRQRRVGEGGREFNMVKLRSMRVDAESGSAEWCSAEDERITGVGKLMRHAHIDELPQLWNVLRGDMTLVGPRPERRELIAELEHQLPYYDRRHLVKPGIGGWAQARCGYGGSEEGTGWKLCHDLFYLKHRSVYFDLLTLIENVRVSVRSGVQFEVRAPQEQFILRQERTPTPRRLAA